jgi:hypothetical protein
MWRKRLTGITTVGCGVAGKVKKGVIIYTDLGGRSRVDA